MKQFVVILVATMGAIGLAKADTHLVDYTLQWRSIAPSNTDVPIDSDMIYQLSAAVSNPLLANDDQILLSTPHTGLSYVARFRLSNADKNAIPSLAQENINDDSQLVSGLYQIGYGGKSNHWYGGVNLSVETFDQGNDDAEGDLWALGFYAGSRLALTGLGSDAPLWTLSLTGEYERELIDDPTAHDWADRGKWYITPGVYWNAETFSLKAGVQVPIDERRYYSAEEPDYRLRANFEHRF